MGIFKDRLKVIIFGTETLPGKLFDILLIISIILSIIVVMLDSVNEYHIRFGKLLYSLEWIFTIFFTIEYLLRIYIIRLPSSYIFSFYGIIDFLALLPTYISVIIPGAEVYSVIRVLRVLRIFRVLKLVQFMGEADNLTKAMVASKRKIFVFLFFVFTLVVILGSIMYLIEGGKSGFDSIPRSIYWAIVTLTTVGYGDIVPKTSIGQAFASLIMIMGYAIIAVPTGIVTSAMVFSKPKGRKVCIVCEDKYQTRRAKYCNRCGAKFSDEK